ncbi:unnamed protein product [Amoebophrya sp. A120]|nr:unnamed protein product [Amoebophrya sp. A120]|eukprot:GSA120T00004412001.1
MWSVRLVACELGLIWIFHTVQNVSRLRQEKRRKGAADVVRTVIFDFDRTTVHSTANAGAGDSRAEALLLLESFKKSGPAAFPWNVSSKVFRDRLAASPNCRLHENEQKAAPSSSSATAAGRGGNAVDFCPFFRTHAAFPRQSQISASAVLGDKSSTCRVCDEFFRRDEGRFLAQYAQWHGAALRHLRASQRETRNDKTVEVDAPPVLVWREPEYGGGGLGDRARGLLAAFLTAVKLRRVFLLRDRQHTFKRFFNPAAIDWTVDAERLFSTSRTTRPFFVDSIGKFLDFDAFEKEYPRASVPWVEIQTNSLLLFENEKLASQLYGTCLVRCLFDFLFRPREFLVEKANKDAEAYGFAASSTSTLQRGTPGKTVCSHFRLGTNLHLFQHIAAEEVAALAKKFAGKIGEDRKIGGDLDPRLWPSNNLGKNRIYQSEEDIFKLGLNDFQESLKRRFGRGRAAGGDSNEFERKWNAWRKPLDEAERCAASLAEIPPAKPGSSSPTAPSAEKPKWFVFSDSPAAYEYVKEQAARQKYLNVTETTAVKKHTDPANNHEKKRNRISLIAQQGAWLDLAFLTQCDEFAAFYSGYSRLSLALNMRSPTGTRLLPCCRKRKVDEGAWSSSDCKPEVKEN